MINENTFKNIQWECVHFVVDDKSKIVNVEGFKVVQISLKDSDTKESLIEKIGSSLEFPSHGDNWDALFDFLRDLSWLPASGYVLKIHNSSSVWSTNPMLLGNLVSVWLAAAEEWSREQKPFHLVFVLEK